MSEFTTVYDLGEIRNPAAAPQPSAAPSPRPAPSATRRGPTAARPQLPPPSMRSASTDVGGSLSLFLPGTGEFLRGERATGLCLISFAGFLVAMGWAVHETLGRLDLTLPVLGIPREAGVWALGGLYAGLALLHVISLAAGGGEARPEGSVHPAVAALASTIFPGWGQLLNGRRLRAALFVAGLWVIAASWILVSPPAKQLMESYNLVLPAALVGFSSPAVRFTLPAVLWTLAIYDAAVNAASSRN